jgi:hypothetical protein
VTEELFECDRKNFYFEKLSLQAVVFPLLEKRQKWGIPHSYLYSKQNERSLHPAQKWASAPPA